MPGSPGSGTSVLQRTDLFDLHRELGARIVEFADYEMPLQYKTGIVAEHLHTRQACSIFDVSHMGQARLAIEGGGFSDVAAALEALVPGDLGRLDPGAMRYTLLLNETGGILDDIIVTRPPSANGWSCDELLLVVNAARKHADFEHIARAVPNATLTPLPTRALIAVQGPAAVKALTALLPDASDALANLAFMHALSVVCDGHELLIFRSGYTGEDGFEISVDGRAIEQITRRLMSVPGVAPAGLGARDSLRLESGYCLYGHDIDEATSPVEAGLVWAIAKSRREAGAFPGTDRILTELANGPVRRRVGLKPSGRSIVREGAAIMDAEGREIGRVTSGAFGPTVGGPIAMGYVPADVSTPGQELFLSGRTGPIPAHIVKLPFVAAQIFRGGQTA